MRRKERFAVGVLIDQVGGQGHFVSIAEFEDCLPTKLPDWTQRGSEDADAQRTSW